MNHLYLVGGPTRVGKSTIIENLIKKHPMHVVATDAVQEGVRSLFVEDPFQKIDHVKYEGQVKYKPRDTKHEIQEKFSKGGNEIELAQRAIIGMLDHYSRNRLDVAMEGLHITPDWVHNLDLPGYIVHAAFVGFTSADHTVNIVEHARQNEHDWINEWLSLNNGDVEQLRVRIARQAESNKLTAKRAEELGYRYFDISAMPFDQYLEAVQSCLLEK